MLLLPELKPRGACVNTTDLQIEKERYEKFKNFRLHFYFWINIHIFIHENQQT